MTRCPDCRKEIPETAKVCGWCGHRMDSATAETGGIQEAPAEGPVATTPMSAPVAATPASAATTEVLQRIATSPIEETPSSNLPIAEVSPHEAPAPPAGPAPRAGTPWLAYLGPLLLGLSVFVPWSGPALGFGSPLGWPLHIFWRGSWNNRDFQMFASIGFVLLVLSLIAAFFVVTRQTNGKVRIVGGISLLLILGWFARTADVAGRLNEDILEVFDGIVHFGFYVALAGSLMMLIFGSRSRR
jgi:hypothetical protein